MSAAPPGLALAAPALNEAQRQTLAEWQAELGRLVAHQRECKARRVRGALGVQLAAAIRDAHTAMAEACTPGESEFLDAAARAVAPYFRHRGDARQAARQFPAVLELRGFLRGPKAEDSLAGLACQAEATARLIERLLQGDELWRFEGGAER